MNKKTPLPKDDDEHEEEGAGTTAQKEDMSAWIGSDGDEDIMESLDNDFGDEEE